MLARFVLPLTELVEVLSIIHDAANRGIGGRGYLDKIQTLTSGDFQSLEGRHDAKLLPFLINHPDFPGANPLIHSNQSVGDKSSLPAPVRF
jgi:hypothetical protein